jgi:uncharacterized protein (TIGR02996 family)
VNLQDAFLKALAADPDDAATRLVYADWLDEHGEHEEADRQRRWPAAKEWLVRCCKEHSRYEDLTCEALLEFGHKIASQASSSERVYFHSWPVWQALQGNSQEFWKNWSIVTGTPPPPGSETKDFHHWECCANENYYWFGLPDPTDPLVDIHFEPVDDEPDEQTSPPV